MFAGERKRADTLTIGRTQLEQERKESMGFQSDVLKKYWAELAPEAVKVLSVQPFLAMPNPREERGRVWVCELAGWQYQLNSPFMEGMATTFGGWLDHARGRIRHYFTDNTVKRVVLLLDCYSDSAKRYLRDRDQQDRIGRDGKVIEGKKPPQTPEGGWRKFLIEQTLLYHDGTMGPLPTSPDGDLRDIDIKLPGQTPGSQYEFSDYLSNGDFKNNFFAPLICRNLLAGLQVPSQREVILRGPNTALRLRGRHGAQPEPLEPELSKPMGEPDSYIGFWAAHYLAEDILVESEDGDVLTNLLLTSSLRTHKNTSGLDVLRPDDVFHNRVILVRNQWKTRYPNTVVLINELWLCMYKAASTLYAAKLAAIRNPVGDQVLLAYLAGSHDYVDSGLLPGVGTASVFKAYYTHILAFPTGITLPHILNGAYVGFHVDPQALCSLIIAAYRMVYKQEKLDCDHPEAALATIGSRLAATGKRGPTLNTVRQLAAQLTWSLNYYANPAYDKVQPPSTEIVNGRSKYGWKRIDGRTVPTDELSIDWLLDITHPEWRGNSADKAAKPDSKHVHFALPVVDTYRQLDPVL